jgi:hypothetical protein
MRYVIQTFSVKLQTSAIFTKRSQLCEHANLLFGPVHRIVHRLPNKRLALQQSCEGFVNMAHDPLLGKTEYCKVLQKTNGPLGNSGENQY